MAPVGTENRARRRSKQLQRRARRKGRRGAACGTGRSHASSRRHDVLEEIWVLIAAATGPEGEPSARERCAAALADGRFPRQCVASVAEDFMARVSSHLLKNGWGPGDLVKVVRRKGTAPGAAVLAGVLRDSAAPAARATSHSPWQEDEAELAASSGRHLDPGAPDWASEVRTALTTIGVLFRLPRLAELRLARGSGGRGHGGGIDERLLTRVRALLAKAESTSFEEEAVILMTKAQELMTRHRIDRAMVEADRGKAAFSPLIDARRCWLDDPYLPLKSYLLSVVARANKVAAVSADDLGFVTLVGHPQDLDATEILFTSLLVQASRRMAEITAAEEPFGARMFLAVRKESAKPSYRRSFFVGFANRIGERLEAAAAGALHAAEGAIGDAFLPVLARQADAVDDAVRKLFGELVVEHVSVTDHRGWAAGAAAADLADLSVDPVLATAGGGSRAGQP